MNQEKLARKLTEFGLNKDEIDILKTEEVISYIRFFHEKNYGCSSILFIGFQEDEITILTRKAKALNFNISQKIFENLTFVCAAENSDKKRVQKAKEYGIKILTKDDFETFFGSNNYTETSTFFNHSIQREFRIGKPLSNFKKDIEVESFSFDSENTYIVNLYNATCTCKDFEKKKRTEYFKGDIRRFCKHLMSEYKNRVGIFGLCEFTKAVVESGYPIHKNCREISIEKLTLPIILNFEHTEDWWNIFVPNEKGSYTRYGYSQSESRFSYDKKPTGIVAELKSKLKQIKSESVVNKDNPNQLRSKTSQTSVNKKKEAPKGCLILIAIIISSFFYFVI